MFFHFSDDVPHFLFESWTVTTPLRELCYIYQWQVAAGAVIQLEPS